MSPQKADECCPKFSPSKYDEKEIEFKDKLFVKDKVFSIFHFPLNFGKVMSRISKKIEAAGATMEPEDYFYMTDESSLFGTPLFVEVTGEVPDAQNVKMSGKFLTKVFEGPYKEMGKFAKQMQEYTKLKGQTARKLFFYYPYCPNCAKKYDKNYAVILAQVN